ncbi:hypothetical protein BGY98DRAFT_995714 [Russula aff. rugulosa BPL654]|nr:hypothetical protein BGY98DRAFT_995714 [Russula aff. rugulosa BPL654]
MQAHEHEQWPGNSSHVSARRSPEASVSLHIMNSDTSGADSDDRDPELGAPGRRRESTLDERPPLGVKPTGYRLLITSVILAFGITKALLFYMGQSATSTLELIEGPFLGVILYWIGLLEPVYPESWRWFFHVDVTPSIWHFVLRFMGGVLGVLFAIRGRIAIASLCSVPFFFFPYTYVFPSYTMDFWFWIYVISTICVLIACSMVRWPLRRGAQIRQRVMGFLDDYGLSASLSEEYEWSGTVGIILGFYCGTALVCSPPLAYIYFSL